MAKKKVVYMISGNPPEYDNGYTTYKTALQNAIDAVEDEEFDTGYVYRLVAVVKPVKVKAQVEVVSMAEVTER